MRHRTQYLASLRRHDLALAARGKTHFASEWHHSDAKAVSPRTVRPNATYAAAFASNAHCELRCVGMTSEIHDPLPSVLLPVLIHELNNATQLLTSLNTLLGVPGGEKFLSERAGDMASVGDEVVDLGWLLAALASAAGDDMLMTRRHEHGLEIAANYVRKALRRNGRDTRLPEGALPRISNESGAGWEAAWAFGLFLFYTGGSQENATAWSWRRDGSAWLFEAEAALENADAARVLLISKLDAATFECTERTVRLRLPGALLEAR